MIPFREVWACDFEFRADPGERQWPVCMVAQELHTGREVRLWREGLIALCRAPFNTGPDAVFVAYLASAELHCFLELGWPLPDHVLDLHAEHRVATNGVVLPCGDGLVGALAYRNLAHIDAGEKQAIIRLILDHTSWSAAQQASILHYCSSDVTGLLALLPKMAPMIDWPRALLRGRYMKAVARMERIGVPLDAQLHRRLLEEWDRIKAQLVEMIDPAFRVFDGLQFKEARFRDYLEREGIDWPLHPSGALNLREGTFRNETLRWPQLLPLHELRASLARLRLTGLTVGQDGRGRCLLSPFKTKTGRNAPSNARFIFGPARWMRGLIRPAAGWGIAYVDWSCQEIAIAAGLSGDDRMIDAYRSGDPYLSFAKGARLVPADATKETHEAIRDISKAILLGIGYGMGAKTLASRAGLVTCAAVELLRLHRDAYRTFWNWSDKCTDWALLSGEMLSGFGWHIDVGREPNPRSLRNWPIQSAGAEMMRIAAIAATEAGIEVCAPVHDAFLLAAPLDRLDPDIAAMRAIMTRAGAVVTGGLPVRTDYQQVRWPGRFMDKRGAAMWQRVMNLLPNEARKAA